MSVFYLLVCLGRVLHRFYFTEEKGPHTSHSRQLTLLLDLLGSFSSLEFPRFLQSNCDKGDRWGGGEITPTRVYLSIYLSIYLHYLQQCLRLQLFFCSLGFFSGFGSGFESGNTSRLI